MKTWAPYLDSQRADHESIILQAERDWFMQGVPSHRVRNRVEQMKIFWDHWDMDLIYREAEKRGIAPAYKPLDDAEMQVDEHDKEASPEGDDYQAIIDKCMSDWSGSFEHVRRSAVGSDDSLANALKSMNCM